MALVHQGFGSSGTQDYVSADVTDTANIKAYMMIASRGATLGTIAAQCGLSVALVDAANTARQYVTAVHELDNGASSVSGNYSKSGACVLSLTRTGFPPVWTPNHEGSHNSFVNSAGSCGPRINIVTSPLVRPRVTCAIFHDNGDGEQCYVGRIAAGASFPIDVTDPGFDPNQVLFVSCFAVDATGYNNLVLAMGFANFLDVPSNYAAEFASDDGASQGQPGCWLMNAYAGGENDYQGQLFAATAIANGFRLDDGLGGTLVHDVFYLARKRTKAFNASSVFWFKTPTATGVTEHEHCGITPEAAILIHTQRDHAVALDSWNELDSSDKGGAMAITVMNASAQYCHALMVEDNAPTTNTASLNDDQAVNLPNDDQSTGLAGTFDSMGTRGPKINYTSVQAEPRYGVGMAFGTHRIACHIKGNTHILGNTRIT